jgi:lipoate-protein ligase A
MPHYENSIGHTPVPVVTADQYAREDEEALRRGRAVARVAVLARGALSVGVSQGEDSPCIQRARKLELPVVRRSTGGLGIWHAPGDVVWSLVLPRNDPRVGRDFSRAYARLGAGPVRVLEELGVPCAWKPPLGLAGEYCLLSGRGAVLTVDGRAIGGAAQHLSREALLHHGVLPYRLEPTRLQQLFEVPREVVERALAGWEQVTGGIPAADLAMSVRAALNLAGGNLPA